MDVTNAKKEEWQDALLGKRVQSKIFGEGSVEKACILPVLEFQDPETGEMLKDGETYQLEIRFRSVKNTGTKEVRIVLALYTVGPFCNNITDDLTFPENLLLSEKIIELGRNANAARQKLLKRLFANQVAKHRLGDGRVVDISQEQAQFKISLCIEKNDEIKTCLDPPSKSGLNARFILEFQEEAIQASYLQMQERLRSKDQILVLDETVQETGEATQKTADDKSKGTIDWQKADQIFQKFSKDCAEKTTAELEFSITKLKSTSDGWKRLYIRLWLLANARDSDENNTTQWKKYALNAAEEYIIILFSLPSFSPELQRKLLGSLCNFLRPDERLPENWQKALKACLLEALTLGQPMSDLLLLIDRAGLLNAQFLLDKDILSLLSGKRLISLLKGSLSPCRVLDLAFGLCCENGNNMEQLWAACIVECLQHMDEGELKKQDLSHLYQSSFWTTLGEAQISQLISHLKLTLEPNDFYDLAFHIYSSFRQVKSLDAGACRQWRDALISGMLEEDGLLSAADREDYTNQRVSRTRNRLLGQLATTLKDLERAEREAVLLSQNDSTEASGNILLRSILDTRKALSSFAELHLGGEITTVVPETAFLTGTAFPYQPEKHRGEDGQKLSAGMPVHALSLGVRTEGKPIIRALVVKQEDNSEKELE